MSGSLTSGALWIGVPPITPIAPNGVNRLDMICGGNGGHGGDALDDAGNGSGELVRVG
jgi:hypothetical protein